MFQIWWFDLNLSTSLSLSISPVLVEGILNGDQRVGVAEIGVEIGQLLAGHLQLGGLPRNRSPEKNWLVWLDSMASRFIGGIYKAYVRVMSGNIPLY